MLPTNQSIQQSLVIRENTGVLAKVEEDNLKWTKFLSCVIILICATSNIRSSICGFTMFYLFLTVNMINIVIGNLPTHTTYENKTTSESCPLLLNFFSGSFVLNTPPTPRFLHDWSILVELSWNLHFLTAMYNLLSR